MTVYVIGAGPAGMSAAIAAAENGNGVVILEKNEKIGKKLFITGKGRCNLTNRTSFLDFTDNIVTNKKFLYSAIKNYDSEDAIRDVESVGIKLKTERGNRVFPESDKSSDILKAFDRMLKANSVKVNLNEKVIDITIKDCKIAEIITDKDSYEDVTAVVVATGGISYPATGSTGDGYRFAKIAGHTVVAPVPALTGIYLSSLISESGKRLSWDGLPKIQGISLKNVSLTICNEGKEIVSEFGEMLFTDKGISGPIVLSGSSRINRIDLRKVTAEIDLKPALSEETLDNRLLREFSDNANKTLKNVLVKLVPSGLIPVIIAASEVFGDKKVNEITKTERKKIVETLKKLTFGVKSLEPIERAVVTAGGVSVNEIEPGSMRSKKIKNLYFAGEVIDVDAYTGGFNIQIAMSTGRCAGSHIYSED